MTKQSTKSTVLPLQRWIIGWGISLLSYSLCQFPLAALINGEILALSGLPTALGGAAAIAVFLGAFLAGKRRGDGRALIAGGVAVAFLLTVVCVSLMGENQAWGDRGGNAVLLGSLLAAAIVAATKDRKKKGSALRGRGVSRHKRCVKSTP